MSFTMRDLLGDKAPVIVDECPTGKMAFPSKAAALRAVKPSHSKDRRHAMRPFRCGFCDRYHLGHRRGAIL